MFPSRILLFAKTAVKEAAPKKKKAAATPAASKEKEKEVRKTRDPSKPPLPQRYSLSQLLLKIPLPSKENNDKSTWHHKHGWGLKFYRARWAKYPEPCYWTITKYKPSQMNRQDHVWGVLTWRGVPEAVTRRVSGCRKKEWRYLQEPGGFVIPFTPSVPPKNATITTEANSSHVAEQQEPVSSPT